MRSAGIEDQLIGARIRDRRKAQRISLAELAQAVGVTSQQVQKYETGRNRISAVRLAQIASVLGVAVSYLLGDCDVASIATDAGRATLERFLDASGSSELMRTWLAIDDASVRRRLLELMRELARAHRSGGGGQENG